RLVLDAHEREPPVVRDVVDRRHPAVAVTEELALRERRRGAGERQRENGEPSAAGKTHGTILRRRGYIFPFVIHAVPPIVSVRSVKKSQRTWPPLTLPPSSVLSPSDSRTTPVPYP